jgi:hypothetical protein
MYSQLVKWEKCQKKGTTKRKPKKDVCHFAIVLKNFVSEVVSIKGVKSQEKKKQPKTRTTKRAVLMF